MGQLLILDVTYIMYEAIDTIQAALTGAKISIVTNSDVVVALYFVACICASTRSNSVSIVV